MLQRCSRAHWAVLPPDCPVLVGPPSLPPSLPPSPSSLPPSGPSLPPSLFTHRAVLPADCPAATAPHTAAAATRYTCPPAPHARTYDSQRTGSWSEAKTSRCPASPATKDKRNTCIHHDSKMDYSTDFFNRNFGKLLCDGTYTFHVREKYCFY